MVSTITEAVRHGGTVRERAYLDSYVRDTGGSEKKGIRFLPRTPLLELNEVLPTSAAMGHHMMTAGMWPQYYWCELCSAWFNDAARGPA